ncbi:MAG: replicative DNA helicase [Oscillospiraceae bacterium]|nr:replicative DNA helicase [Oscillospiraceae bacterium]
MAEFDAAGLALPYNPEAEESVIGSLLINNELIGDIVQIIKPEHFYSDANRGVYQVIFNLYTHNQTIDFVTVLDECKMQSVFENDALAKSYLARVMNNVPSPRSASKYAAIVIDKYLLRSLILASKEIIESASSGTDGAEQVMDLAEQKIFNIREGVDNKTLVPMSSILYDQLNVVSSLVEQSQKNGGKPIMSGLSTGFRDLDSRIYGLNRSDLIILAARPGMGKTSFALNIAVNVAKKYKNKSVCVFSLEMSKEQLVSRIMSSEAQVPNEVMRTGKLPNNDINEFKRLVKMTQALQSLDIYIDDTPGTNVSVIKSKLRRIKDLGFVIIDYLQLMNSVSNYHGNRVAEISEITRSLKIMAKELNVPVIVLSQLARGTEQRPDKRPMMSDLRDSGSIEQDADIVMFLYRNSYYDKTDPNTNTCECIVAKNRHGETGTVYLGWFEKYTKFTDAVRSDQNVGQ